MDSFFSYSKQIHMAREQVGKTVQKWPDLCTGSSSLTLLCESYRQSKPIQRKNLIVVNTVQTADPQQFTGLSWLNSYSRFWRWLIWVLTFLERCYLWLWDMRPWKSSEQYVDSTSFNLSLPGANNTQQLSADISLTPCQQCRWISEQTFSFHSRPCSKWLLTWMSVLSWNICYWQSMCACIKRHLFLKYA